MPQVDLESLICGGCGDTKVACETTLTIPEPDTNYHDQNPSLSKEIQDTDLPAESFIVPITDWLNSNPVYDRDDSTKGTTNPKSHHQIQKPPSTGSQRFSGNLKALTKAPIIGLPNTIQHSGYLGQSARRTHGHIFPQRGVKVSDPGSPKVSCFGKVLSERERNWGRSKVAEENEEGCWLSLKAAFRCFGRRDEVAVGKQDSSGAGTGRKIPVEEWKVAAEVSSVSEPPGLVGMKRFVSGRRPASWGGDVEVNLDEEDRQVALSGPLDRS